MFGIPADTALAWANVISLSGLAIAAAGAIVAHQLAARMNAAHHLELLQVQSEARTQIEFVAAEAHTRTTGLKEANEELQLELQSEREARKKLSKQTRDITDEQMVKFVDTVKGKVRTINVFTAPDHNVDLGIANSGCAAKSRCFRDLVQDAVAPDVRSGYRQGGRPLRISHQEEELKTTGKHW